MIEKRMFHVKRKKRISGKIYVSRETILKIIKIILRYLLK